MSLQEFLASLGAEIEDPEEEAFLLFSQSIPSQDLGFIDSKATTLDLNIGNQDLVIHQSPTILSSNRGGGTTGAVVWKVTPLFAEWISSSSNLLFQHSLLDSNSTILELGCGISGIIGLALGSHVANYVLTDQQYVSKLLHQNLLENRAKKSSASKGRNSQAKSRNGLSSNKTTTAINNITFQALDWETDEVTPSLTGSENKRSFEAIIACDCIYNDTLIKPLVQTCVDASKLRETATPGGEYQSTIVIVGQQLRSDEVFESWLQEFHKSFRVWRMPDEQLLDGLKSDSGFVIHIGILREQ